MKPVIYIAIALLSLSCLKLSKNEYYIRMTGLVEIIHTEVPDTVDNMSFAQIKATAQATDGCWSDLNFMLIKNSDFEYSLQAFGVYESYGTCPTGMVYSDTTINVQPSLSGLYKFYIYKGPNEVEVDTMIVR